MQNMKRLHHYLKACRIIHNLISKNYETFILMKNFVRFCFHFHTEIYNTAKIISRILKFYGFFVLFAEYATCYIPLKF